jgi:hypothetical protein
MAMAAAAVVAFAFAARAEPDAPQNGKLGARIGGKCTYVEHPGNLHHRQHREADASSWQ